ncbi:hypothetical protein LSH36_641g01026 [Paralvinella palmiformis]|uniref:Uncharacterized protein n=1 Tax=Paralvinella palmiformis TaxID=53620 RepID=A0AAD9J526_9ANNE|nr:hypothetical protein LSH36_641g01026 [Paralvinella palmiformis]
MLLPVSALFKYVEHGAIVFKMNAGERRKSAAELNSSSKAVKIKANLRNKWQGPSPETITYIMDVIDTSIQNSLSMVDVHLYEEVENTLTRLKNRLKASITRMKVPRSTVKSYHAVDHIVADMDRKINSNICKTKKIEQKINQTERLINELEQEKEKLEQEVGNPEGNNVKLDINPNNNDVIKAFEAAISSMTECFTSCQSS